MNLISTPIELPAVIEMSGDAKVDRQKLIEASKADCPSIIESAEHAQTVGAYARDIRTNIKSVKEAGLALRRPLDQLQKRIMAIENDYCAELQAEQNRLEAAAGQWNERERKRVADEEARRQAEVLRLEKELQQKNEDLKAAAELASGSSDQDEAMSVMADAEKARQEAMLAQRAAIVKPIAEVRNPTGMGSRKVLRYELKDQPLLLAKHPELFSIELRKSAVNSTCFAKEGSTAANPDTVTRPGLSMWWEFDTVTRAW